MSQPSQEEQAWPLGIAPARIARRPGWLTEAQNIDVAFRIRVSAEGANLSQRESPEKVEGRDVQGEPWRSWRVSRP
jgi:hypothetical protein